MHLEDDEMTYILHYGILRRSGRYPWGSGGTQNIRNKMFVDTIADMKRQGMSETEIARGFGITTTMLRDSTTVARNMLKQADIARAQRMREKGMSNVEIGKTMGINESSVRSLLKPGQEDKAKVLTATADMLRRQVAEKGMIDVGVNVEHHLGLSKEKLSTAVSILKEEGYTVRTIAVEQVGSPGKVTKVKVLAPPGTTYGDIASNKSQIKSITDYSVDGGRTFLGIIPPMGISDSRVGVRYKEQGGADADGVIYVRPGVDDVSLGGNRYAQVRVMVNNSHYLKGMAMYSDDLPAGVDLVFNTNKSNTGNKLDAMKPLKKTPEGKVDPDNPFGSSISRQITRKNKSGKDELTSVMNIVNEEGDWDDWSRNLSSQMLSKQNPRLAQEQLGKTYTSRREELDSIMELTNPAVRKKLLDAYADSADSAAIHLKAAQLPRQSTHVILPINSLKDNEVYAPNFKSGEQVVLIRFPHGGIFEIPELTVNNNHPKAKKALGQSRDAIGINAKVAERLSGADFDGDTVLVIPNNQGKIKTAPALEGLKGFDPKSRYPKYDGMKVMDEVTKGFEMGDVSNLITDMTIKKATPAELARAVRHSMVVIDAAKHELNYKQSAIDNGIRDLKRKYQGQPDATGKAPRSGSEGAATLISRATSRTDVLARKPRSASKGGPIDPETGKKVYEYTNENWVDAKGKVHYKKQRSVKLAETDDARTLSSGTLMESIYADHSNKMKALANEARKASHFTKPTPYSPSAKAAYSNEVATLNAKLQEALKNAPRERQAQLLADSVVSQRMRANPNMDEAEIKKLKSQALAEARARNGAKKSLVVIEDSEWQAIQAGAISNHKLEQILRNSDIERVKELATPRTEKLMTSSKKAKAMSLLANGYTQAEVAEALGISLSTLKREL